MIKMRWFFSFGLALFLAASVGCGEAEQKTDDGAPERDAAADDNAQPPDADAPDVDDAEDSVDIEEVDVCVPNCDGRLCGDDGCGNSCGQCATGQECEDGTCVKQCLKLNRTEVTASWKPIHGPDDPRGEFYYQEVEENGDVVSALRLSLIHISEPTRLLSNSYAVLCLEKKKQYTNTTPIHYTHTAIVTRI